jgi:hypothetical protein
LRSDVTVEPTHEEKDGEALPVLFHPAGATVKRRGKTTR